MKKLISSLKQIRIGQILTVFLAGLLIFVSTACGSGGGLQARAQTSDQQARGQTSDQIKEEVPESGATSPYEGGMNEFLDTEPRQDISDADAKAKSLVEEADRNVTEKSVDSLGQYVENYRQGTPLGERVQNITKSIGGVAKEVDKGAKDTAADISKGAQRGLEDIKGNVQSAAKGAQRAAEDTSDFAQRRTGEAAKGARRAAEDVPGQVSRS